MSSIYVSPGVYTQEKDLSQLIPNISTTVAGLVGYSTKGDITQLRLITNTQQFIQEYGEPELGNYFHYTALAFLENGQRLYCMRVVNGALYGGVEIKTTTSVESNGAISSGQLTPDFDTITGEDNLFMIFGKDPGAWNNNLGVRITNIDAVNYEFDIEVYLLNSEGTYDLVETFTVSRKHQLDGYSRQEYLEERINGYSQCIWVADNIIESSDTMPKAQSTTLALAQGSDGSAISDSQITTGWDFFANPDDVDVRLLLNGGQTSVTVQTKMKTIAEARKDCIAVLDMPYSELDSVSSMITWRTATQNFNSSYCALYAPWVKIYDQYNDSLVEIPPSGYVGSQIAYNDYAANFWYAPAGFNRGILNVLGLTDVFTQGERDSLYEDQINPLQTFRGEGNVIWGQKTQQTRPSALDRINVRRLLIVLEKAIAVSLRQFVFEPNSENTRLRVTSMCEGYLDGLSAQGAFQTELGDKGYKVVCDTTNNTPTTIDANELHVDIFIKPSRTAEFIQLGVIVTSSGASFSELIARNVNL